MPTSLTDIRQISPQASDYPASVRDAYGTAAPIVWAMGNLDILARIGIGFCGSRKASDKGLAAAEECAGLAAAQGFSIISGYAAGVDVAAHRAALLADGTTIIVLPEGLSHFRIRRDLKAFWDWRRILVVSQFECTLPWRADRAMARNRMIIALSRSMIVIEAGDKGGTLDAGRQTLRLRKPLFVVEYTEMGEHAAGNRLLLEAGGQSLRRLRSTGQANVVPVIEASRQITSHEVVASYQPALL